MEPQEFLTDCLVPAAIALNVYDTPHLQLGLGTGIQESKLQNVQQHGGGPALGPFQMEPATHDSLWVNFIQYRPALKAALQTILGENNPSPQMLMQDLIYSAAMMFVKYLSCPGKIPEDLPGQAAYYKKWYNTPLGAATEEEYIAGYQKYAAKVVFPT